MRKTTDKLVVIITGASAGIGLTTAKLFQEKGHKVYSFSRRMRTDVDGFSVDVTDETAVSRAMKAVIDKEGKIDVLINNAGFGISGAIEDTDTQTAKRLFDVNFFGALNAVKCALPYMRAQGGGSIVNVSSAAAEFPIPFQAFYSASKAAIGSFSDALRLEVAPFGVKVSSVLPGDVKTEFTDKREKNASDSEVYGERINRSVAVMEKDERNGMPPLAIAKIIYALATSANPPVKKVGGFKYAFLVALARVLPTRAVSYAIGKLYS